MTIQSDFEALQVQAVGPTTPVIAKPSHAGFSTAGSAGGSLGGAFVGTGGTVDGATPTLSPAYRTEPRDGAATPSVTEGVPVASDIWEEVYDNKAKACTYIKVASTGQPFHARVYGANWVFDQY